MKKHKTRIVTINGFSDDVMEANSEFPYNRYNSKKSYNSRPALKIICLDHQEQRIAHKKRNADFELD